MGTPPRTFLGVIGLLLRGFINSFLGCVILLVLWFILPSPVLNPLNERYIDRRTTITRIYDNKFSDGNHDRPRNNFELVFQIDPVERTIEISQYRSTSIKLSYHVSNISEILELPKTEIELNVRWGDIDGINPGYFNTGDATLLFWHIHGDLGIVAMFGQHSLQPSSDSTKEASQYFELLPYPYFPDPWPILQVEQIEHNPTSICRVTFPALSYPLSATYRIRNFIQGVLVPWISPLSKVLFLCLVVVWTMTSPRGRRSAPVRSRFSLPTVQPEYSGSRLFDIRSLRMSQRSYK